MFDFHGIEDKLLEENLIKLASQSCDYEYGELKSYIITSIEEAKHTLSLINRYDLQGKNILEFGSGLGITSIVLHLNGYKITSFEPGGLGFEKNILVNQCIKDYLNLEFELVNDLKYIKKNSFDFIFSNNVLEHIPEVQDTFVELNNILVEDGIMLHNVPNYIIPYEPHFGVFFCPIYPKKMSFMINRNITNTNLWKSLNFINSFDVKSYSKGAHATVVFDQELIYKTIMRLKCDKEFSNRHSGISKIINFITKIGLLKLLRLLPVFLNTPMVFEWRKNVK